MYEAIDAQVFVSEPYSSASMIRRRGRSAFSPSTWRPSAHRVRRLSQPRLRHRRLARHLAMGDPARPHRRARRTPPPGSKPVMALPGILGAHVLEGDATSRPAADVREEIPRNPRRARPHRAARFLIDGLDRDTTQSGAGFRVGAARAADTLGLRRHPVPHPARAVQHRCRPWLRSPVWNALQPE